MIMMQSSEDKLYNWKSLHTQVSKNQNQLSDLYNSVLLQHVTMRQSAGRRAGSARDSHLCVQPIWDRAKKKGAPPRLDEGKSAFVF